MNTSELMIGDWVYSTFSKLPCKVTYLKLHESGYASVETTNVVGVKDIASLSPIPLTPEILEKNGLNLIHGKPNCFDEDRCYRVELTLGGDGTTRWTINFDEYDIISLNHVHQLQHVLRLCEIEKEIVL